MVADAYLDIILENHLVIHSSVNNGFIFVLCVFTSRYMHNALFYCFDLIMMWKSAYKSDIPIVKDLKILESSSSICKFSMFVVAHTLKNMHMNLFS